MHVQCIQKSILLLCKNIKVLINSILKVDEGYYSWDTIVLLFVKQPNIKLFAYI